MTENERQILVEWMEIMVAFVQTYSGQNSPRTVQECIKQYDRMKQLTAQLRDADKPAGGEAK